MITYVLQRTADPVGTLMPTWYDEIVAAASEATLYRLKEIRAEYSNMPTNVDRWRIIEREVKERVVR